MSLEVLRRRLVPGARSFSPFFMLGDPDPDLSVEIAAAAVAAGAGMLELGIPFSDPVADGPSVQAAALRARGTSVDTALRLIEQVRARVDVPLNLLVYGNLVHARGASRFARELVACGASSLLVPDVPLEEDEALRDAVCGAGLGFVELCGPLTPPDRLARLGRRANAFLYLTGHQGVTGARTDVDPGARTRIAAVRKHGAMPVAVGFGLREPGHVRAVLDAGASVAIVGSALCDAIGHRVGAGGRVADPAGLVECIQSACARLAAAASPGDGTC